MSYSVSVKRMCDFLNSHTLVALDLNHLGVNSAEDDAKQKSVTPLQKIKFYQTKLTRKYSPTCFWQLHIFTFSFHDTFTNRVSVDCLSHAPILWEQHLFYLPHSKQPLFCLPPLQISAIRVIRARRRWHQSFLLPTEPPAPASISH